MAGGLRSRPRSRIALTLLDATARDTFWVATTLLTGAFVVLVYLTTHPYPAYGGGLFVQMADAIRGSGYALPSRIDHYTDAGVPFAYPPLMFYVAAVLRDLGVGAVALTRFLPGILAVAYLVPYYGIARELLETRRRAGVATLLLSVTPDTLQWHISAGGMVRAGGFLLALTGVYVGVRLFRTRDPVWALPASTLFGLTVLTHPVYTVFFGTSYLVLYAVLDRSRRGLAYGAAVALGGVLLASPWWTHVASVHGLDVFTAAAGTHSGLAGGLERLLDQLVYPLWPPNARVPFFVATLLGVGYLASRRRLLMPVWLLVTAYVVGKHRFLFVAGSMAAAVFLFDVVVPRVTRLRAEDGRRATVAIAVVALVAGTAVGTGALYAGGALDAHGGTTSQPAFVDDADVRTMEWAERETDPSAEFVVLGDAAEWFPLFSERTILVGPWGVEWRGHERYETQLELFRDTSACDSAACLTGRLRAHDVTPDYVYVPKDTYTIRGITVEQSPAMVPSLVASDHYEQVYENEGVVVFRFDAAAADGPSPEPAVASGDRPASQEAAVASGDRPASQEAVVAPGDRASSPEAAVREAGPATHAASRS